MISGGYFTLKPKKPILGPDMRDHALVTDWLPTHHALTQQQCHSVLFTITEQRKLLREAFKIYEWKHGIGILHRLWDSVLWTSDWT